MSESENGGRSACGKNAGLPLDDDFEKNAVIRVVDICDACLRIKSFWSDPDERCKTYQKEICLAQIFKTKREAPRLIAGRVAGAAGGSPEHTPPN